MLNKKCSRCGKLMPISSFHKHKTSHMGIRSTCKECDHFTNVLRLYGLSKDEYINLLHIQGGKCAICEQECKSRQRLAVDHCHDTNKVRGLLCNRCNRALGLLLDDVELVSSALSYLKEHR